MFNTVESLYEKIQLYFTKWFLLCFLQRDENEWFTSVSVNYTRVPFMRRFTWSWVRPLEVIVSWFPFPAKRRTNFIQSSRMKYRRSMWNAYFASYVESHLNIHPSITVKSWSEWMHLGVKALSLVIFFFYCTNWTITRVEDTPAQRGRCWKPWIKCLQGAVSWFLCSS